MPLNDLRDALEHKVREDFGEDKAREMISAYDQAQNQLRREIYENIRGSEPSLTDHGTTHVADVQEKVVALLSESDGNLVDLSGVELYCLAMLVLFHDVGNVYGREEHQNRIAPIFDKIRGTGPALRREKTLVVRAARAHTGTAHDGSYDTLKELDDIENLLGRPVRHRELAAILRFADELAEGPQRTSGFMQEKNLYDAGSKMHHDYASSTNILIDRAMGRIAITYEIDLKPDLPEKNRREYLSELLKFVYQRLTKLDQERQYVRHYSKLLEPFKSTEAAFNFHCDGEVLDIDILPLKLTDKVVIPGEDTVADVATVDGAYAVENLVPRLIRECPGKEKS